MKHGHSITYNKLTYLQALRCEIKMKLWPALAIAMAMAMAMAMAIAMAMMAITMIAMAMAMARGGVYTTV